MDRDTARTIEQLGESDTLTQARRAIAHLWFVVGHADSTCRDVQAATEDVELTCEQVAEALFDADGFGDELLPPNAVAGKQASLLTA